MLKPITIVAASVALFVALAAVVLVAQGPSYTSTITLDVPVAAGAAGAVSRDDIDYTDRLLNTYKRVAEAPALRDAVRRRLADDDLDLQIVFDAIPNTELVRISVRTSERERARQAAAIAADELTRTVRRRSEAATLSTRRRVSASLNRRENELRQLRTRLRQEADQAVAARLSEEIRLKRDSYQSLAQQAASLDLTTDARTALNVAEPASAPAGGVIRDGISTLLAALVLGVLAGLAVVLLRERRSPQIRSVSALERLAGVRVVEVTHDAVRDGTSFPATSPGASAIATLRTQMVNAADGPEPRTYAVTSQRHGPGRSIVALNLATSLARARRRVLLIDGDLARGRLHEVVDVPNDRGLSDLLAAAPSSLIQGTDLENLSVLTRGPEPETADELVASREFLDALREFGESFDFVVIDAPPLGSSSDAVSLTSAAGHVLLVVEGLPVPANDVLSAGRDLERAEASLMSVILFRPSTRGRRSR